MIPKVQFNNFKKLVDKHNLLYSVEVPDVASLLNETYPAAEDVLKFRNYNKKVLPTV